MLLELPKISPNIIYDGATSRGAAADGDQMDSFLLTRSFFEIKSPDSCGFFN